MMKTKFKETEIGMIPEDWEVKPLGELGVIKSGKKRPDNEGIYPVYGGNGILTYADEFNYENIIIIGRVGAFCGNVFYEKDKFWLSDNALGFKNNPSSDLKYLFYLFKHNNFNRRSIGGAQPLLTQTILKGIKLPCPHLWEQKKISKILSDLDSKIELLQNQNETLEKTGNALFKQWFVDFEFPNEKGKPYKSSGGEMVDSEFGEIPKGWKVDKLGIYVDNISGCSYTSNDLQESQTALVTLKSIDRKGKFKQDGFKEYVGKYKESQVVKDGDIVVAHTDLTQNVEVLGSPALVSDLGRYKQMIASLDLSIVRPKRLLNLTFIYFLLKTNMFHSHAVGYSNGTTVIHLSKKAIPEFMFTVPEKPILIKFEKIIGQTIQLFRNNEKMINTLQKTRDLLLPKLMSGKIMVNVNE